MWNYRNSGVGYGGLEIYGEIYGYDDMDMVDMWNYRNSGVGYGGLEIYGYDDMVDMWKYLVLLAPDLQHLPVFRRSCANKSPAMFRKMCCLVISRKLLTNFLFMSSRARVQRVRLVFFLKMLIW